MSKHLFGLVVTPHGTAANNRGENEGNIATLQKLLWNGEVHTTISDDGQFDTTGNERELRSTASGMRMRTITDGKIASGSDGARATIAT